MLPPPPPSPAHFDQTDCRQNYRRLLQWNRRENWRSHDSIREKISRDVNFRLSLGVQVGPGLGVVVIRSPFQTKFQFCWVPHMGGIKLQLLCGVRIELAVGTLPHLARNPSRSLPIPLGGTQSTFLGRRGVTNTPTPWAWGRTLPRDYP